jgi:hypothetical protein
MAAKSVVPMGILVAVIAPHFSALRDFGGGQRKGDLWATEAPEVPGRGKKVP